MQDPTTAFQVQAMKLPNHFPELEQQLKCPRCDSTNTKFCYYNNYNLSQPRHFCKNCRRYWTKGGALRNIPVGGGSRKTNKRSSSSSTTKRHAPPPPPPSSSSPLVSSSASHITSTATNTNTNTTATNTNTTAIKTSGSDPTRVDQDHRVMNIGGSFSSLLGSSEHFGTLLGGLNSNGSGMKMVQVGEFGGNFCSDPGLNSGSDRNPGFDMQSNGNSEGFLAMQNGDSSCWNGGGGGHGWSDLAIYTPSPRFR